MSDVDDAAPPSSKYPTFTPSSAFRITRLTRQNYPLWRAQIVPYRRGQRVFGFVDGSIEPPSPTITDAENQESPNPDYLDWSQTDNLILGTITSSLSEEVLLQVYTASTSAEIWLALQTAFASQSRAKVVQLRAELAALWKNEATATEYYFLLKRIADYLKLAGHGLSDDDFVAYLLAGLGSDYDALVTTITCQPKVSIDELYSLLLTTEARITHNRPSVLAAPSPSPPSSAVAAHYAGHSGNYTNSGHNYGNNNTHFAGPNNSGRGSHNSRGRGRSGQGGSPRPPQS